MNTNDDATVSEGDPVKGLDEQEDEAARSVRKRTPTEKGAEYTIQLYRDRCSTKKRAWMRAANSIYAKVQYC